MVDQSKAVPDNAHVGTDGINSDEKTTRLIWIRKRYAVMQTYWSPIHDAAKNDDAFVAGEHWPDDIRTEREEDGRPMLTYNLLPAFVRQIKNKVRQERPQIRVKPVETNRGQTPDVANIQGTKDYSLSDVYMGIIRNVEHTSRADQAYDTALSHAVDHGFGYFKLRARWSTHDPFVQELVIERVKDSYGIYLDPDARMADYSDAQDGFEYLNVDKTVFERDYPEASTSPADDGHLGLDYSGWYDEDSIRVAQYYWIKHTPDEVVMLSNGGVHYWSDIEDVIDELEERQGVYVQTRPDGTEMRKKILRPRCHWLRFTGMEILEEAELVFETVPLFPVLGEEIMVDGETRYESAIRHAIDAQRSYNYWRTAAAETAADFVACSTPMRLPTAKRKTSSRWTPSSSSSACCSRCRAVGRWRSSRPSSRRRPTPSSSAKYSTRSPAA